MSVRVVVDGPRRPVGRRLARLAALLLAVPLVVLGALGLIGSALMAMWLGYVLLEGSGVSSEDRRGAALTAAVSVAAAVDGLGLGVRLLRGRRRLVLFLRRFGFADATRTVSYAAAEVIGRSWRLVTLDDERIQAVGGSKGPRRLSGFTAMIALAATAAGAWWFASGGPGEMIDESIAGVNVPDTGDDVVASFAAGVIGALVAALVAAIVVLFIVVIVTAVGVSSALLSTTYGLSRRSEHAKRARIASENGLRTVGRSIAERSRRIFAPRLVVVSVATPVWQHVVRDLAQKAAAVIVDVSVPSENLRWEIRSILPVLGSRCVLVGRLDLVTATQPDGTLAFVSPLAADLEGHDVLGYGTSRRDLARFGRALQARLDAVRTAEH